MSQIILRFELHGKHYSRVMEILDSFELYGFTWCVHYLCSVDEVFNDTYAVSEINTGANVGQLFDSVSEAKEISFFKLKTLPEETVKQKIEQMTKFIEQFKFTHIEQ